jgi:osmoprotectant transport system ATP-binding protein
MSITPSIEIDKACKSFDGGRTLVVRRASLRVKSRAFLALLGTTGSGKTTLLKFINRLIRPDSGTVKIDGEDVAAADPPQLRRRIGYVFQGAALFPNMSVEENIGITPRLLGWQQASIAERVKELLDLVELPQRYCSRDPATLSGGERQRVAIARSIAARPRIVLMDEPFGALDPVTRDAVGAAYRKLHDQLGLTTIMVTHDVQEALLLADQIAVMKAGEVLVNDTPQSLMAVSDIPDVADLMAMPRRWAERIRTIVDKGDEPF